MYLYTYTSNKGNILSFFYEFNPENKEVLIKKYRIDYLNKFSNKSSFIVENTPFKKTYAPKRVPNDFKEKMVHRISQLKKHTPISIDQNPASYRYEKNKQKACLNLIPKQNFHYKKLKIYTFRMNKLNAVKIPLSGSNIYRELKEKSQKMKCYSPNTTQKILHIPQNHLNPFHNFFASTYTTVFTSIGILLASLMIKILSTYSSNLLPLLGIVSMISSLGVIIGKGLEVQSNYQSQLITIKLS
jgi:hypothetical protein